jgi:hypothetical protein
MSDPIRSRPTPWKTILLTCGKCARKLDGGFGPNGKDTLKSALRIELTKMGRRREVRIIETRCVGVCPRKAVTVINAERPGTILTVPRKTGAARVLAVLTGD